MHIPNIFAAASLVGAALLLGAPARAQDDAAPRETVRIADLDLMQAADARVALTRIRGAIARVCGPEPDIMAWTERRLHRACVDKSLREVVAEARSASLASAAGLRTTAAAYDVASIDPASPHAAAH